MNKKELIQAVEAGHTNKYLQDAGIVDGRFRYVAVCNDAAVVSSDGFSWFHSFLPKGVWVDLRWVRGFFLVVSGHGVGYYSDDGEMWEQVSVPRGADYIELVNDIVYVVTKSGKYKPIDYFNCK